MSVLVASLGDSPAVITATLDALERADGTRIDTVVTIGTSDFDVNRSSELLNDEIRRHYDGRVIYMHERIEAQDLLTEEDHVAYLALVAKWLKTYRGRKVYLSLSGGRKTMVALVTLAAQIYGASALCHIVPLDLTLEEQSKVQSLSRLPREAQRQAFHPAPDAVRLVRLPLVSLFPLLHDLLTGLRGSDRVDARALDLLLDSNLVRHREGTVTATSVGQQLLTVLDEVELLPPPRTELRLEDVIVRDHGYGGKRNRVEAYARTLYERCPWATRVETIAYGNRPKNSIRAKHPDGRIELDLKTGEFSAGLCVSTTARSAGETERVARELEKLLQ